MGGVETAEFATTYAHPAGHGGLSGKWAAPYYLSGVSGRGKILDDLGLCVLVTLKKSPIEYFGGVRQQTAGR